MDMGGNKSNKCVQTAHYPHSKLSTYLHTIHIANSIYAFETDTKYPAKSQQQH